MYEILRDIFAFIGAWFCLALLFGIAWARALGERR